MMDQTQDLLYGIPSHVDYTEFVDELDQEDIPQERIEKVENLLTAEDFQISFRAAFLLSNWGNNKGYKKLLEFLNNTDQLESEGYEAHRLHQYNIVYEQILSGILGYKAVQTDKGNPTIIAEVFQPIANLI